VLTLAEHEALRRQLADLHDKLRGLRNGRARASLTIARPSAMGEMEGGPSLNGTMFAGPLFASEAPLPPKSRRRWRVPPDLPGTFTRFERALHSPGCFVSDLQFALIPPSGLALEVSKH
jgi:hypothetical protein